MPAPRSFTPPLACAAALTLAPALAPASAAPVVLNEYNAVGGSSQIKDGDTFFGAGAANAVGNGGNWIELLVVDDHVDARGWRLAWTEDDVTPSGATTAGEIVLSDAALWSDLRAGTLLTFIETDDGAGSDFNTSTNTSFDPAAGDWWINVSTQQEQETAGGLVTTVTNDGAPGDFSVGKDDWALSILEADGTVVFGPAGEGALGYPGGGVSGTEGGSLEGPEAGALLEAWQAITGSSDFYDDTGSTSFGAYNVDFDEVTSTFVAVQDPSALQALVVPEPATAGLLLAGVGLLAGRRRRD